MYSIFSGKTIESVENRDSVRICRTKKEYIQEITKKTFKREIIVNTDMVIVTHKKSCVFHNKPFYVGYSILELSKMVMYSFYYKVLKSYYPEPDSLRLVYSDTDSLLLSSETSDLLGDLKALEEVFDFSNLPSNHSLYDDSKRSKLFHFKEEFGLLPILRFVSLGSKVYSIQTVCCHDYKSHANGQCADNIESGSKIRIGGKTCTDKLVLKGVSRNSKQNLAFEDYFHCLLDQNTIRVEDHRIQSRKQKITSSLVHKIALTSFCDKVLMS